MNRREELSHANVCFTCDEVTYEGTVTCGSNFCFYAKRSFNTNTKSDTLSIFLLHVVQKIHLLFCILLLPYLRLKQNILAIYLHLVKNIIYSVFNAFRQQNHIMYSEV